MRTFSEEKKQANIEQRASRTAMMAAIHRFLASKEEHPNFQGPDHLAALFLPPKAKFFLPFAIMRRYARKKIRNGAVATAKKLSNRHTHFWKWSIPNDR